MVVFNVPRALIESVEPMQRLNLREASASRIICICAADFIYIKMCAYNVNALGYILKTVLQAFYQVNKIMKPIAEERISRLKTKTDAFVPKRKACIC